MPCFTRISVATLVLGLILGSTATQALQGLSRDDLSWLDAINTWTAAIQQTHGKSGDPQKVAVAAITAHSSYQIIKTMALLTDRDEDRQKDLQRMARIHLREWGYRIDDKGELARAEQ